MGFFGFNPPESEGQAAQPRWRKRVRIEEALSYSRDAVQIWLRSRSYPDIPLYSGGLLDAWPARVVEEQSVLREEWLVIKEFLASGGDRG